MTAAAAEALQSLAGKEEMAEMDLFQSTSGESRFTTYLKCAAHVGSRTVVPGPFIKHHNITPHSNLLFCEKLSSPN